MIKLPVYIVTMNEKKRLPLVLDFVKDLADEIVVVDPESTDRTEEIGHEYVTAVLSDKFEYLGHHTGKTS